MQLSQTQTTGTTNAGDLVTWAREIDDEYLRSFVDRHTNMLGEIDSDDFDIAAV